MDATAPCGHSVDVGDTASPEGDRTVTCTDHDPDRIFGVQVIDVAGSLTVNGWSETEVIEG